MKVSVIIPTYNRSELLMNAIKSVDEQNYGDIEIIVVDDGSTDKTSQVIEDAHSWIRLELRYIKKTNGGCASARNRGLAESRGDVVTFLDSDDRLTPTSVSSMVECLIKKNSDFVYSPAVEVLPDGSEFINYPVAAGQPGSFAIEHFLNTNVRNGAVMYQQSVFGIVGNIDENLLHNEDSDFLQRVAIKCKGAYSSVPAVKVYRHSGNKSLDRVAIYRSLLVSSENILKKNPQFVQDLGNRAEIRLDDLRSNLAGALIRQSEYKEASRVARAIQNVDASLELSILLKSIWPLKISSILQGLLRR